MLLGQSGLALVIVFAGSCDTNGDDAGGESVVVLTDSNNYRATSILTLPVVETASGSDLEICWDQIADDIRCHDVMAPMEIKNVALSVFPDATHEEVQARLGTGEIPQSELEIYRDYNTSESQSCAQLSELTFFGTPIDIAQDYVESEDRVYLLVFSESTLPGVGALSMTFVRPTLASTDTRVDAPSGCGFLEFEADLSGDPVPVPAEGPWVLDWKAVTEDGLGNALPFTRVDSLMLGFYAGMTVADLESQILDLEQIPTDMWTVEVVGEDKRAELANATHVADGSAFTGFDGGDGVWLVALRCSTCQNPAPLMLSILEPGAAS